jgi:peptide deformylase
MAIRPIAKYGNKILREKTKEVIEITEEIKTLINDMFDTMYNAEGVGLAANQVSKKIALAVVDVSYYQPEIAPFVIINPSIMRSLGESNQEEGCLSIPNIRENVARAEKIVLRYMDPEGKYHEKEFQGLCARVLQHEVDHLNGVFFIDRISLIKRKLLRKSLIKITKNAETSNYQ